MQLKHASIKPQLHSSKCHSDHTYNGTRSLPLAIWVRSPTLRDIQHKDCTVVYEIILYYEHNRACTIYRTWDDFKSLRRGLTPWKNAASFSSIHDVKDIQHFLKEAISKRWRECALEFFLRRRFDDCGGL